MAASPALIQMAAETMLFHHPAAHWISRRIRTEREYCCDDVAVSGLTGAGEAVPVLRGGAWQL